MTRRVAVITFVVGCVLAVLCIVSQWQPIGYNSDRRYALLGDGWFAAGEYFSIQRWQQEFNPGLNIRQRIPPFYT